MFKHGQKKLRRTDRTNGFFVVHVNQGQIKSLKYTCHAIKLDGGMRIVILEVDGGMRIVILEVDGGMRTCLNGRSINPAPFNVLII